MTVIRIFTEVGCAPCFVDIWLRNQTSKIEISENGLIVAGLHICVPKRSGHYKIS